MSQNGARAHDIESASIERAEGPEAATAASVPDGAIDAVLIGQLARLLGEGDLAELEIEKGDLRIRMVRYSAAPAVVHAAPTPAPAVTINHVAAPVAPVPAATIDMDHPGAVKSPMVGTAYLPGQSREPRPFVEVGSIVKVGRQVAAGRGDEDVQRHCCPAAPARSWRILVEDGSAGRIWRTSLLMIVE